MEKRWLGEVRWEKEGGRWYREASEYKKGGRGTGVF